MADSLIRPMHDVGAHLVDGAGLVIANNRGRVVGQSKVSANTTTKTALTGLAFASTACSGVLGAQMANAVPAASDGGTCPPSSDGAAYTPPPATAERPVLSHPLTKSRSPMPTYDQTVDPQAATDPH